MSSYSFPIKKKINDPNLPQKINTLIFKLIDCQNYEMTKDKISQRCEAKIDADTGDGRGCVKATQSDRKNSQQRSIYEQELFTWIGKFSEISKDKFFENLNRVEQSLGEKNDSLLRYVHPYCKVIHKRLLSAQLPSNPTPEKIENEDEDKREEIKQFIPPRPMNPRHY